MSHGFSFEVPPADAEHAEQLVAALARASLPVATFEAQLREVVLEGAAHVPGWLRAGLRPALLESAARWLQLSLPPADRFLASAVQAGGVFDGLVFAGGIPRDQVAGFLDAVFTAILDRAEVPVIGAAEDAMLRGAQQWLCDLFVDAVNADRAVLGLLGAHLDGIVAGERTVAQLFRLFAERVPADKRPA